MSQSGDALVRQTHCQTQASLLHPSSLGLAPRPVPGGGTGAGRERELPEGAAEEEAARTLDRDPAALRPPELLARLCGLVSSGQLMPSVRASHSWL